MQTLGAVQRPHRTPWSLLGPHFPTVGCNPGGSSPVPTTPFKCQPALPRDTPRRGPVHESSGLFHPTCTERQSPFPSVRTVQHRVRRPSFPEGFLSRETLILLGLCRAGFHLEMVSETRMTSGVRNRWWLDACRTWSCTAGFLCLLTDGSDGFLSTWALAAPRRCALS